MITITINDAPVDQFIENMDECDLCQIKKEFPLCGDCLENGYYEYYHDHAFEDLCDFLSAINPSYK